MRIRKFIGFKTKTKYNKSVGGIIIAAQLWIYFEIFSTEESESRCASPTCCKPQTETTPINERY